MSENEKEREKKKLKNLKEGRTRLEEKYHDYIL